MDLDELNAAIEKAKSEWLKENADIRSKVFKLLDNSRNLIIMNLLGFSGRDNFREIDHCNGRAADSFIGKVIKNVGEQAALDWLGLNLQEVKDSIAPKPEVMESVIRHAREAFNRKLAETLQNRAAAMASDYAGKLLPAVVSQCVVLSDDMLEIAPPDAKSVKSLYEQLSAMNFIDLCLISEDVLDKWLFRAFNNNVDPELIKKVKDLVTEKTKNETPT